MKLIDPKSITKMIKKSIDLERPLSLVRLGDGEYSVIRYPKTTSEKQCKIRIGRWFDIKNINRKQIVSIRNQIHRACQDADILGVPSIGEQKRYPKWKYFYKICGNYHIITPNKSYFYFYHIIKLNYQEILKGLDIVYCITCRDISRKIEKKFGIKKAEIFLIPPERYAYRKSLRKQFNKWDGDPHYPDLYDEIVQWFKSFDLKGRVFLIGAGGLGKIYCMKIKQLGGIAIDVGALFDAWAGVCTRPYLKTVKELK